MNAIIRFIIKHQFVLLFLLLEIIALVLFVQNNGYQKIKYQAFAQDFDGYLMHKRHRIGQYFGLKEVNNKLSAENLMLRRQIEMLKAEKANKDTAVNFTSYIGARVIDNSVNKPYNYVLVDKGAKDGVKPEMAVISNQGVVGLVASVSKNYSLVASVLNRKIKVSAKIKKNGYFGSFEWDGLNYRYAYLHDIPYHAEVKAGDTIVTSGYSLIFPENIPVGVIDEVDSTGGNFLNIRTKLSVDYKKLDF
ncbi:MAG TPA: rod shape-determining protein MreC, partial [Bacteroidales bacterium]